MIRLILVPALLLATSPAFAESPAKDNRSEADRVICKRTVKTGSRISAPRECRTRAEWEAIEAQSRQTAHDWQHTGEGSRQ